MEPLFADMLQCFDDQHTQLGNAVRGLPIAGLDWVPGTDMNSLCVLVVHTCGSTRYWVGDVVLGEVSGRNRATEFEAHGLADDDLLAYLSQSLAYLQQGLARLTLSDLARLCDAPVRDRQYRAAWALSHALEHFGTHTGHAQITRQLWDSRIPG